ncbi:hypothetical protein RB595_005105 [Gaeumannomyces hyphopodioides]
MANMAEQAPKRKTKPLTIRALCAMESKNCARYKQSFRKLSPNPRGKGMSSTVFLKQTAFSYGEVAINLLYSSGNQTIHVGAINMCSKHIKDLQVRTVDLPDRKTPTYLRDTLWSELDVGQFTRVCFYTRHREMSIEMNEDYLRRKSLELGDSFREATNDLRDFKNRATKAARDASVAIDLFISKEGNPGVDDMLLQLQHVVLATRSGHPAKELFRSSPSTMLIQPTEFAAKAATSTAPDPVRTRFWDQGDYTACMGRAVVDEHLLQRQMAEKMRAKPVSIVALPIEGRRRQGMVTECLILAKTSAVELLPRVDEACELELIDVEYTAPKIPEWLYDEGEKPKLVSDYIVDQWQAVRDVATPYSKEFCTLILQRIFRIHASVEGDGENLSDEQFKDVIDTIKKWFMTIKPINDCKDGHFIRELNPEWRRRLTEWAHERDADVKVPDWQPDKDDRRPWKVTRVPMPDNLAAHATAAFIGIVPRHPLWTMTEHPDTGEPVDPLPLIFHLPKVKLDNPDQIDDEKNHVQGVFLPTEHDLPMTACVQAINTISQQAAENEDGPAAFLRNLGGATEFLDVPDAFPIVGRLVQGDQMGEDWEIKLKNEYDKLNQDQKKVFRATDLPFRHLMVHGAPGSGKTSAALLLAISLLGSNSDPSQGVKTKAREGVFDVPMERLTEDIEDTEVRAAKDGPLSCDTERDSPEDKPLSTNTYLSTINWDTCSVGDLETMAAESKHPNFGERMVITCSENIQGDDLCERMHHQWSNIMGSTLKIVRLNTMTREINRVQNVSRRQLPEEYDEFDVMTLKAMARDMLETARNVRAVKKSRRPHGGRFSLNEQVMELMQNDPVYTDAWGALQMRATNPYLFEASLDLAKIGIKRAALQVLNDARVIVATPTALHTLRNHFPDICNGAGYLLQEEAGRMTEPEWLVGLATCPNVKLRITTGDPNQSPPLVLGTEAFARGASADGLKEGTYCQKAQQLATSPMRRWTNAGMPVTRLMMTTRQSGHQERFISRQFYQGDMRSLRDLEIDDGNPRSNAEMVAHRMFRDHNIVGAVRATSNMVLWTVESKDNVKVGTSWTNEIHTKAAMEALRRLQRHGLSKDGKNVPSIGIICPYQAQRNSVAKALQKMPRTDFVPEATETRTTRSSMGQEWDYAIVVLTKDDRQSGFTSATHNLVVSLSRGRFGTIVIMSESVTKGKGTGDRMMAKLLSAAQKQGDVWQPDKKFFMNYCMACGNSHKAGKCWGARQGLPMKKQLSAGELQARLRGACV